MISSWFKKLKFEDDHPPEKTLLACVDGELSAKQAARVRAHLESCWSCRAQLDELQDTITLFVNFRNQIQNPLAAEPPNNWRDFDRKLARLAAEIADEDKAARTRLNVWERFKGNLNLAEWSPTRIRFAVGATAMVLIVALVWGLIGVRSVSAAEILENSIRAQRRSVGRVNEPIIYQNLRLERAEAKPVQWETWHDAARSRYRHALTAGGDGRRYLPAANAAADLSLDEPVLREVAGILRANRMNPQRPLSAESFRAWRNSLAGKKDEISRSDGAAQTYTLTTASTGDTKAGSITEAALTVQATDWHATALRFSVKTDAGASEYKIVETAFEIVSLPSLNPAIFPPDEQPAKTEIAAAPNARPSPAVSPSPAIEKDDADSLLRLPPTAPPVVASAELEVEALRLLNQVGADIGEEATATRTISGELLIQGVVETPGRKAEILRALAPLAGQPGLAVRIETSQEAQKRIARERIRTATRNNSRGENDAALNVQPLEIRDAIPADADVRRYLRSTGTPENLLTGEVNRLATRTLNRSNQILLRALSLRNLANRFSENQLREMKPEARNQWLDLIAARAVEVENQSLALRQELGAIFGSIPAGGESIAANDEAELKRLAIRLSELAANNDRAVRAAFTFSSGASDATVKGAQFRESLNSIQGFANSIRSAARRLQTK